MSMHSVSNMSLKGVWQLLLKKGVSALTNLVSSRIDGKVMMSTSRKAFDFSKRPLKELSLMLQQQGALPSNGEGIGTTECLSQDG